jgi:type IV pilus assembly protein PilB
VRESSDLLGRILVHKGLVTPDELTAALEDQRVGGERIGAILIRRGATGDEEVHRALACQLSLPFRPPPLTVPPEARALVRPEFARKRGIVPLEVDGRTLRVAPLDPLDIHAVEDLRFQTGKRIEVVVSTRRAVSAALESAYPEDLGSLVEELPDSLSIPAPDDPAAMERAARAGPVIRLVQRILDLAVLDGASDIHIEPTPEHLRVRTRVDGVLRPALELPRASGRTIVSRLKVMAGMDISVRLRPQDGGFDLDSGVTGKSARVSTLPSREGEKAVIRILDPTRIPDGLGGLGLPGPDLERLRRLIRQAQGVVLVTGPTGSGKSSTLFGALAEVNREELNVVTVEDPVEYHLPGATQVQVNPRAGLGFPEALRAILRQDPDVVMIGEIRDRETAEIAMAAAVTGHLVLTTLHTMDAPGAIVRLLNMGVPPHLVSAGVSAVVAQRLLRRICGACRGTEETCSECRGGLAGRTGIFQLMTMSDPMRDAIMRDPTGPRLRALALEGGMRSMEAEAARLVTEGTTTRTEVLRVVQPYVDARAPCRRCHSAVPAGAVGCPHCGSALLQICRCGAEVEPDWRYCPHCIRPTVPPERRSPALSGPGSES